MRVLELYSGIGGLAAALVDIHPGAQVVAALDINHLARKVYETNFSHPTVGALIEFLPRERFQAWRGDLWWMSPPCQPFTRRGKQRDAEDPRARTFLRLLEHVEALRPPFLALENVPGFRDSEVHGRLRHTLDRASYAYRQEVELCPSDWGWPNRRPRYYLLAGQQPLAKIQPPEFTPWRLQDCLNGATSPGSVDELQMGPDLLQRYDGALHIVDVEDPAACTNTFTSAYGRSHVRSGSYLRQGGVVRRFSPREILALLDFPAAFRLPGDISRKKLWQLVGNSLSLPAVRHVLRALPKDFCAS